MTAGDGRNTTLGNVVVVSASPARLTPFLNGHEMNERIAPDVDFFHSGRKVANLLEGAFTDQAPVRWLDAKIKALRAQVKPTDLLPLPKAYVPPAGPT